MADIRSAPGPVTKEFSMGVHASTKLTRCALHESSLHMCISDDEAFDGVSLGDEKVSQPCYKPQPDVWPRPLILVTIPLE